MALRRTPSGLGPARRPGPAPRATGRGSVRTATRGEWEGPIVRLHIGLENPDDLIEDLAAGFERLGKAG